MRLLSLFALLAHFPSAGEAQVRKLPPLTFCYLTWRGKGERRKAVEARLMSGGAEMGWVAQELTEVKKHPTLEVLRVSHMRVRRGSLAELRELSKLRELHLELCEFENEALWDVAKLGGLRVFSIDGRLRCRIDDSNVRFLGALRQLRVLHLRDVDVGQTGVSYIGKLPKLEELRLVTGEPLDIEGLRTIGQLRRLRRLEVVCPGLKEEFLAELRGLTSLRILWLRGVPITGEGFRQLRALKSLQELHLWRAEITAGGVRALGELPGLQKLTIRCGHITEGARKELRNLKLLLALDVRCAWLRMETISHMRNLRELRLWWWNLDENGLAGIRNLVSLERLFVAGAEVGDADLERLSHLKKLRSLDLTDTSVTDAGLAHLSPTMPLQELGLAGTEVTDACIPTIMRLSSLRKLDLSGTKVTEAGIRQLVEMPHLELLKIPDRQDLGPGAEERLRKAFPKAKLVVD